jgi:hypothetical protein
MYKTLMDIAARLNQLASSSSDPQTVLKALHLERDLRAALVEAKEKRAEYKK